jgi:hypothetical protein
MRRAKNMERMTLSLDQYPVGGFASWTAFILIGMASLGSRITAVYSYSLISEFPKAPS